ncbi:MAG: hypothetical protein ACI4QA_03145 [Candidatus Spyradosoma sp.]
MKALTVLICALCGVALSGCLYSPDVTYTYWRRSEASGLYSPIRSEVPLTPDEMRELGLVEQLPENAKTVEAR